MRYIALLRGINVGGNTMIKMADLRQTFERIGFTNVVSYVNSGNFAFDSLRKSSATLSAAIEKAIKTDFDKAISVVIRKQSEIERIIAENPFAGDFESHKEMHVLFLKEELPPEKAEKLLENQTEDERFGISGEEIYCHLKLGVADSLLGKGFIDKKLKVTYTARNWRTVQKLSEL